MTLQMFFRENPRAAMGFSGGVDSAYLLWAAHEAGAQILPVFVKTAFQPTFELQDAQRMAAQLGVELMVAELDILSVPEIAANPPERCYHCKRRIFEAVAAVALERGYSLLLDGTNASDDAGDRPGMRALRELSVRSPLRECGLTKDEIRRLSHEAGLFTWDKPAYACLATRVPAGRALDADMLRRVECAEDALRALGFSNLRVRVYHDAARLQLPSAQLPLLMTQREAVLAALRAEFPVALLDLETR